MSAWTFIAQRATTGEFIHWDLPIELRSLEWELSGPGALTGTFTPDDGTLRADDGQLLLEEWGTLLYAEADGQIRWGGIVISCSFEDEAWAVEAAGFSTYPHGTPFEGEIQGLGLDPADVIRAIWAHVQSYPDSNLAVAVTGATATGALLGTEAVAEVVPPHIAAARAIRARIGNENASYSEDWTWADAPAVVGDWNDALIAGYVAATGGAWDDRPRAVEWLDGYLTEHSAEVIDGEDAEPYVLAWWEAPDCGDEIDTLATTTPLDYIETHRWSEDREQILHEVQLFHPRAGRRRDDLSFVQGDNVTSVVSVESNGDDYANAILGLGAGEGRGMLRRATSLRDGRLRRSASLAEKATTNTARLDALIAAELTARRAALRITSVDVVDHPNAPLGSWELGDDVLLRADLPWLGEVDLWVRITGWALTGEGTATLTVARSDSFTYGG